MDNTTAYLAVLARIMQEERAETTTGSWEHYEKLYALVHTDLTTQLKASRYPDAPALQKKAEGLLDEMEPLYLCPELAGTGCLLISDYHTNTLFEPFRRAFLHWADIAPLFRLQTQIPFLIVDSEEDQLEVLNYANRHVALSPAEYELLLTESGKNRVALNKIVQVFLLRTPLAVKNVSLIFDNVYHRAEQLFGGAVSRKIACLNSRGFQTASKRGLDHFDAVTCKPELVPALKAHPALCHCPRMDWAMLVPCLSTIHPILYGFQYRFQALFTQMECYYLRSSNEMQEVVRQITDDIVRLGEKQNDALPQLRQSAKEAGDQLNNEWNALQPVLETIHTCLTENEKDLRDLSSSGKEVPRRVWDAVFEIFFTEEREKTRFGQKIEASLRTLEYPELPLVQAYLKKKAGKPVSAPVVTVGPGEWEKARMLLELQNPDSLSRATLRQYVDLLKPNRLSSGREYYAKSLIATFPEDVTSALTESFQRGYLPAGEKLLQLYNCASSSIDLSVLVNGLLPEACVAMAQRSTPRCATYSDLADPGFTYYKLAAVKGYLPAIQFIVDKLYDSGFSTAKRIGSTSLTDAARKKYAENGKVLCSLCHYLIEERSHQSLHNSEILGVVLFCLGESYSEAMCLLSGIDTGVSNFCKGCMYHHGYGVAQNTEQAIRYYQLAALKGFKNPSLQPSLRACYQADAKEKEEQTTAYQEKNSYKRTTSNYQTHDSGCFITTATCRALHAGDDCRELNLLRWFRDNKLQSTPQGEAIVREYYRVGPLLVQAIDHTPDPDALYQSLWEDYIRPSCTALENRQWEPAKQIYVRMVKTLCLRFGVEVRPQICEALKDY